MTGYPGHGRDGHTRDALDIEALVADRYLEALLAAGDRQTSDAPDSTGVEPGLRDAARVLRRTLVRVHPSFRFEERLAGRLAELAAAQSAQAEPGRLVAFAAAPPDIVTRDPALIPILDGTLDPADPAHATRGPWMGPQLPSVPRPVIVGGAMASAALSLAGVVLVVWRAAHPVAGPRVAGPRVAGPRAGAAARQRALSARVGGAARQRALSARVAAATGRSA